MFKLKYPHLFEPVRIGPLLMRNRIMSSPASQAEIDNMGFLTDRNISFYKRRAQGGAGIVTVGDCIVHETGIDHPKQVKMWEGGGQLVLPSLTQAAYAIKQHGAIANIQLSHGGELCEPAFVPGGKVYGPRHFIDGFGDEIFEMDIDMIHEITEAFGDAAATAKYAGFDMCQLHAGHHWLLGQFLSRTSNQRGDEYGGSLENRARFLLEVIANVREKCGALFPIEVRISATEFPELTPDAPNGITIEEACALAELLDGKVEIIHCSVGNAYYRELSRKGHPSMFEPHGANVKYAAEIKKHVAKSLVACVGGLSIPDEMEEIIASGKADICAIGRALIADPDIPRKARAGRDDDIRPCLRCSVCLASMTDQHILKCTVNPIMGRELENQFAFPAAEPKRVLIAGGGPAGMQCALTAVSRGHEVTLCEKGPALGGMLNKATHESFKNDLERYRQYLIRQVQKSGIKVLLNTDVTAEYVNAMEPDVLVIAVGASPVVLPLPGMDGGNVLMATEMYDNGEPEIGKRVAVMGGGLVGCEIAVGLHSRGHEVHIIEMQDDYAPECNHYHKIALTAELEKGVHLHLGVRCAEITPKGVRGNDVKTGEDVFVEADTVISCFGLRSRSDAVDALYRANVPHIIHIGDCAYPRQVTQAVHEGHNAAMDF
ncbi:MAG: FAD-dependent oxidoreductase [Oscillospiraceae bacterium]|jgi:2,4-dienoyl-CoA reductase-like NADH-dependent reductase (Old Yellow Enzyme family)/thioredoxin reductase